MDPRLGIYTDVTTTVQLSTSDGTAMAGQDYTTQSLTLTFTVSYMGGD